MFKTVNFCRLRVTVAGVPAAVQVTVAVQREVEVGKPEHLQHQMVNGGRETA